ncbi:MAG: glycosyltransferase family 4 protein [Acidobacteria bacterium]|nr:glycosyltransferase family 4 protein [Acidobacteriota bacterium]
MTAPRVAVIAYFAPPARAVARLRIARIIASLTESGADVHVFRPAPPVWRPHFRLPADPLRNASGCVTVHDTPHPAPYLAPSRLAIEWADRIPRAYSFLDRLAKFYPDEDAVGWTRALQDTFLRYGRGDFDLVVVSGGPFTPILPSMALARSTGARFWVDYRDPFTDNPHIRRATRRRRARDERNWLHAADLITTVSPSHAELLRAKLERGHERVTLLWNYMDAIGGGPDSPMRPEQCRLTYAGGFYRGSREIAPLLTLLKRMGELEPRLCDWTFEYIGAEGDYVRAEADRLGVASRVECIGVVPSEESLRRQRGANAALCIASTAESPTAYECGNVSSKFFELLANSCRIVVIGPREHDLFSLSRTVSDVVYVDSRDVDVAAASLACALIAGIAPARSETALTWTSQWSRALLPALRRLALPIGGPSVAEPAVDHQVPGSREHVIGDGQRGDGVAEVLDAMR